jgi:hypothetical protein
MSFTVEDFHDLIALLAQHPEWRAELRRHVLSDELLSLPALVQQLAEAQTRAEARLEGVEARLEGVETRLSRLEAAIVRLEGAVEALVDAQGSMDTRLGRVEGTILEIQYARRAPAYFGAIARRLRVVETGPLADLLDDAVEEGRLTGEERDTIMLADLVLTGRRRQDGHEIYLLAELSVGIGPHDVERAIESSTLLGKLGRIVLPIVAGERINAEAAQLAHERGVWYALDGRIGAPRGA